MTERRQQQWEEERGRRALVRSCGGHAGLGCRLRVRLLLVGGEVRRDLVLCGGEQRNTHGQRCI